jgi:hypothetical protein
MSLILLLPNVIRGYISNFPEVKNNAYKYFNYDRRVVEERVPRFDEKAPYVGANQFSDGDYEELVSFAHTKLDQNLAKYSMNVACDDALNLAVRSFRNGRFDGKVNAGRYSVLLGALKARCAKSVPKQEN